MDKEWMTHLPIDNIKTIQSVSGGSVNQAYKVETEKDTYFLLVQPNRNESFFTAEIAGLEEMQKAGINAPRVINSGEIDEDAFLILTYLEEGHGKQADLGKEIAKLHHYTSENGLYGFNHDYTGKDSTFSNEWTDSWVELFVENRLDVLISQLNETNFWQESDNELFKRAREIIVATLEPRQAQPSLLHGDLWGGNFMFLTDGSPAFFDPSPMYGDREFDIGVSTVFGVYNKDFYDSYQKEWPLDAGYRERLIFYHLYLLMVHSVKFGVSYYDRTITDLKKIVES